ncbi:TIGR02450 family Trp-rich protein [Marinomonas sp. 2405UD68-3]|uniref:TIGR02450 family Trp-rich protein n=1 Tax=Marinomonas sp. 2405UD68-3 TaxID=3391835 RepID=UPI0039C90787
MIKINPKKLQLSKWTAINPINKEKHFIVVKLIENDEGFITHCVLESVFSKRQLTLEWQVFKQEDKWEMGWK